MIQGLDLISPPLSPIQTKSIQDESQKLLDQKGIRFRILEAGREFLTIHVNQVDGFEFYFSAKELATETKAFFQQYFPEKRIHARPKKL